MPPNLLLRRQVPKPRSRLHDKGEHRGNSSNVGMNKPAHVGPERGRKPVCNGRRPALQDSGGRQAGAEAVAAAFIGQDE